MAEFICKRCGYKTARKHHYIAHIKAVNPCPTNLSDITREQLLQEYPQYIDKKPRVYTCKYCKKEFGISQSMYRHQKTCKEGGQDAIQLKRQINALKTENALLKMRSVQVGGEEQETVTNGYLYIILLREFVNNQLPIYKIGRSKDISSRIKQYPKNSKLLYCTFTTDIESKETQLINKLKDENSGVIQQLEYGTEYFLGDYTLIRSYIEQLS